MYVAGDFLEEAYSFERFYTKKTITPIYNLFTIYYHTYYNLFQVHVKQDFLFFEKKDDR